MGWGHRNLKAPKPRHNIWEVPVGKDCGDTTASETDLQCQPEGKYSSFSEFKTESEQGKVN